MAAKHSKRVALYLRASSDDQTESLGAQRMLLVRYAADNNLKIVGEYEDFAKSGDSCNGRDGLQRLMAAAKAGKFDGVLVRQLSRLSRRDSMKTAAQIIGPLLDAGVSIFTASHGNLELNSATGRIMLAVLCEFDHAENVSRSFNVVSGQHKAAMAGSWIGAAPYAYVIEGEKHHKQLVLNGDEALATVRRIFELYADGESAAAIANLLNAEGIPSPSGNHWTFDTVGDILQRPVYVGDHRFNYESRGKYYQLRDGKPVERFDHWVDGNQETARTIRNNAEDWIYIRDHWPAIVSRKLWDRVQRRRSQNALCKPRAESKPYRFSGMLRCGCGGKRPLYGRSPSNHRKYNCRECGCWVDEAALVEAVATAIMDSLKPKTLDRLRAAITKKIKQPQRRAVNIKSLERQLEKQNRKLLVLDADMVGPVQAEIRRLRREIEQAKRTHRDSKQREPGALVDAALGKLKDLPRMLADGDDQRAKVFLQEALEHVKVWTRRTGTGTKTRYVLDRGEIHFGLPTAGEVSPSA